MQPSQGRPLPLSLCWEDPEELCRHVVSSPAMTSLAMQVRGSQQSLHPFPERKRRLSPPLSTEHPTPSYHLGVTGTQNHEGPTSFRIPMSSNMKEKNGARAG